MKKREENFDELLQYSAYLHDSANDLKERAKKYLILSNSGKDHHSCIHWMKHLME